MRLNEAHVGSDERKGSKQFDTASEKMPFRLSVYPPTLRDSRRVAATVWKRPSSAKVTAPGTIAMISGIASWLKSGIDGNTRPTEARLPISSIRRVSSPQRDFSQLEYAVPAATPIRMDQCLSGANWRTTSAV